MNFLQRVVFLICTVLSVSTHSAESLSANSSLYAGQALVSSDSQYSFNVQRDGNLVVRNSRRTATWSSATYGTSGQRLVMKTDGNLVLYSPSGAAIWETGTAGSQAIKAVMQADGNLALLTSTGTAVWTTGSGAAKPAGNSVPTQTGTVTGTSSTAAGITLPIEVLGPSATAVDVSVSLNNAAGITHLYLRCNACGYEDIADNRNPRLTKATVSINGGASIALKHFIDDNGTVIGNRDISVIGGEAKYGGIGGAFRTARFTVKIPANQLRTGPNTLRFEHVDAVAPSIGFRIIDLNFLENGDINRKALVSNRDVVLDDPTRWTAPRPAEVQAGASLWTRRNTLYDPLIDMLDGRGGKQGPVTGNLRASCADCHTQTGHDLKFFNFSNHSIVQRSLFHGLTKAQGEQIASYIRSNRAPVTRRAWPWNPAYQPGPQLDSISSTYEWAAGAGIDAVLDDDQDMAKYLFPGRDANNPASLDEIRRVVNRFGKLNLRELPINIPMPEWNQWLPVVHPDDAFNTDNPTINSTPGGTNVGKPYYTKMVEDAMANPNFETLMFSHNLKPWLQRGMNCQSNGPGAGEPWRGLDGNVLEAMRLPRPTVTSGNCQNIAREQLKSVEYAKRGLSAWSSVKMWEIMHEKALEEASRSRGTRVCISGTCVDGSEVRGWNADGRNVFDRPPHFTAVSADRRFLHQSPTQGIFESNQWYHLNMILNPGYRVNQPSHFAYTYSHVELLHENSRVPQGFRFWATMIKQRQLQTTGRYGVEEGLDLRTAQPYIYYGTARNRTSTRTQASVGPVYWPRLAQAMVEDFVDDASNANWSQHWSKANRNSEVQAPSSSASNFRVCSGTCEFELGPEQGSNTYKVIPELRRIGVGESALNKLIDWSKTMWPKGDWEELRR